MLTGETIDMFLDKDAINWGEAWREKVDEGLATVAFFVPVITPRYFRSPECRRELQFFARKAQSLGVTELVLPLLYVDDPSLHEDKPKDELVELIRTFQWVDWRQLRFEERASAAYRRNVSELAARLVAANEQAALTETVRVERDGAGETDEAGVLDKLVDSEQAMGEWTLSLQAMTEDVEIVGALMNEATADIAKADAKSGTFAARLAVTKKLATKLQDPADRILERSSALTAQLHRVDDGLRVIIETVPTEVGDDPDLRAQACEFFDVVRNLSTSAHEALEGTIGMIEGSKELESLSRDLRKPLRTIRQGLTTLVEGREISDEWIRLIDASGLDCGTPG
jgi:hypothetical protein